MRTSKDSTQQLLPTLPAALASCLIPFLIACGGNAVGPAGGSTPTPTPTPTPSATNEWTWVSGSMGTGAQLGVYGSLGVAAATNVPGSRVGATSWTDPSGKLWLFGGSDFNDLWQFDPTTKEWTWVSGSNVASAAGVYGTQGVPATSNVPGSRVDAASWTDKDGNLWLFGGVGVSVNTSDLNDLWEFNPIAKTWRWVNGERTVDGSGVYGTLGTATGSNVPGSRNSAASWRDGSGNFWLFGGQGYDSAGTFGLLNDLWEFNPATQYWAWMGGSATANAAAVYGAQGVPAASNVPGARSGSITWTDASGNLWLFGGSSPSGINSDLNDLWEFNPSAKSWTWVGGNNTTGIFTAGIYGTQGVAATTNRPGSRSLGVSWVDKSGNLWLFGGQGYDSTGTINGDLSDLWKFNPATKQWTWINGPKTIPSGSEAAPGVYGTLGVPAVTNLPGGRDGAVGWTDSSGNFWLFGGEVTEMYNDLWQYQP